MRWTRVVVALLAVLVAAVPAVARERAGGQTYSTSDRRFDSVGGHNATTWSPWWVDVDGVGHVTEAYPDAFQTSSVIVFTGTVAANTSTSLTAFTPYASGSIHGPKLVRIATSGFAAAAPWRIKFVGSADGSTYAYLMNGSTQTITGWTDTDTLVIRGHGNTVGTLVTGGRWHPLVIGSGQHIYPKFLAAIFSSDSSAGATGTATIEIAGRQQ
jgi:hypothetical protein